LPVLVLAWLAILAGPAQAAPALPGNGLIAFVDPAAGVDRDQQGIALASPDGSERRMLSLPLAPSTQAAWNPHTGQIALVIGRALTLMSADGKIRRRLPGVLGAGSAFNASDEQALAWSPDGRTLAYTTVSPVGDVRELRTFRPQDGVARTVARFSVSRRILHPGVAWSADGRRIDLFRQDRASVSGSLLEIGAQSGRRNTRALPQICQTVPVPAPVAHGASVCSSWGSGGTALWLLRSGNPPKRLDRVGTDACNQDWTSIGWPAWDARGAQLAYSLCDELVVRDAHGRLLHRLPAAVPHRGNVAFATFASFSPDGRRVLLSHTNLDVLDLQSGALRSLRVAARDDTPRWSPDGSRLAFVRRTATTDELLVWSVAGFRELATAAHQNAPWPGDEQLAWSPDGTRLVWRERVLDAASGAALWSLPQGAHWPAFSPDAGTIAYTTMDASCHCVSLSYASAADGSPSPLQPPAARPAAQGEDEGPRAAFSPDGAHIAWDSTTPIIAGLDGAVETSLPGIPASSFEFSADGSRLLVSCFLSHEKDESAWMSAVASPRQPWVVSSWVVSGAEARFSPDGSLILYTVNPSPYPMSMGVAPTLWIGSGDGSPPRQVLANAQDASWQPLPRTP
jgi:hypothetical protein